MRRKIQWPQASLGAIVQIIFMTWRKGCLNAITPKALAIGLGIFYLQAEHAEQAVQAQHASMSRMSKTISVFSENGSLKGSKTSILGENSIFIVNPPDELLVSQISPVITSLDLLLKKEPQSLLKC